MSPPRPNSSPFSALKQVAQDMLLQHTSTPPLIVSKVAFEFAADKSIERQLIEYKMAKKMLLEPIMENKTSTFVRQFSKPTLFIKCEDYEEIPLDVRVIVKKQEIESRRPPFQRVIKSQKDSQETFSIVDYNGRYDSYQDKHTFSSRLRLKPITPTKSLKSSLFSNIRQYNNMFIYTKCNE